MKRLSSLFLFIFCFSFLLAGCTININMDDPPEDTTNKAIYESRASIYIVNTIAADTGISSSDLQATKSLVETYSVILQSNMIQGQIREEFPDVEYTLSLEPINETEICTLIAAGDNPEYLDEICNMAASLLCEELPQIIAGSSCKVIDYAKPAQQVDTN